MICRISLIRSTCLLRVRVTAPTCIDNFFWISKHYACRVDKIYGWQKLQEKFLCFFFDFDKKYFICEISNFKILRDFQISNKGKMLLFFRCSEHFWQKNIKIANRIWQTEYDELLVFVVTFCFKTNAKDWQPYTALFLFVKIDYPSDWVHPVPEWLTRKKSVGK